MKIGIITLNRAINHGAFLQAYAMKCILEKMGHVVLFLTSKETRDRKKRYGWLMARRPHILMYNLRKVNKFVKVQTVFNEKCHSKAEECDLIIVGSDELWNVDNETIGYIPMFFGDNLKHNNINSYAVSFGSCNQSTINNKVVNSLKKFNSISVRDFYSRELLKQKTGTQYSIVADPTLLYDFKNDEKPFPLDECIVFYGSGVGKKQGEILSFLKESTKLPVISIGFYTKYADRNVSVDPFEFLSCIKNAKYFVTNTFHGTIFAAKYNKKFITFMGAKINKIQCLAEQIQLSDRVFNEDDDKYKMLQSLLSEHEYVVSDKKVKQLKEHSLGYLRSIINDNK